MAKKRLLVWHRPSRRWKKQTDLVVRYYGYGKSERDLKSYRQAEQRYLDFMTQRQHQQPIDVPLAQATIIDVAEKYLQHVEQRHNGKQVTASYLCKVKTALEFFIQFVGGQVQFRAIGELLLADYRAHILTLPQSPRTNQPIRPATAKDRLTEIKAFYGWAYEMGLCELPKNLKKYARLELPEPQPKRFTIDEIKTLWKHANSRMRCFIVLALNCGYGQIDITELRVNEIDFEAGVIDRKRTKTGVRARHKLWPVTMTLIKEHMQADAQGDDRVFLTVRGNPLVVNRWTDGKMYRTDSINCLFRRLRDAAGIDRGRGF